MSEEAKPEKEICESCNKITYRSQRDANTLVNSMHKRKLRRGKSPRASRSRVIPCRSYECPEGNGWHLTRSAAWGRT